MCLLQNICRITTSWSHCVDTVCRQQRHAATTHNATGTWPQWGAHQGCGQVAGQTHLCWKYPWCLSLGKYYTNWIPSLVWNSVSVEDVIQQWTRSLLYPRTTKLLGGILVSHCPSILPASCVSSVAPIGLVGSISYLYILSSNFRRCVACKVSCKISKFEVLAIF